MHSLAPAGQMPTRGCIFNDVYKLIYGIQMGTLEFSSEWPVALRGEELVLSGGQVRNVSCDACGMW